MILVKLVKVVAISILNKYIEHYDFIIIKLGWVSTSL